MQEENVVIDSARLMFMMRTAEGAVDVIKQMDPNTAVTVYFVRQLIKQGKINHVKAGKKYLICVGDLVEYFKADSTQQLGTVQSGIRKINE